MTKRDRTLVAWVVVAFWLLAATTSYAIHSINEHVVEIAHCMTGEAECNG